jgi:tetratricopeptide (TPR) repeat protein
MNRRALVFVMALSCPLSAVADTPRSPPTAAEKQKAAEHFDRARVAYSFGNYDDAIREYQAAFDLTGAPEYVFNIAQTQRAKGDKRGALVSYKKYIELDPTGAGVTSARSHIDAIQLELDAEVAAQAKRDKERADAEAKRKADAVAAAEAARRDAAEVAKRRVSDAEAARRRTTSRYFRIAGLSTGAAGLATLGVSAFFGFRARALSRDASSVTGMWTEEAQRDVDRATSAERTMYLLLGVGGGVAITGGILYVIGARSTETRRVAVTPTAGGAAVTFGGKF